MQIELSAKVRDDFLWFTRYYAEILPEGRNGAVQRYRHALILLSENPRIGSPEPNRTATRRWIIARTPFTLIYRVDTNRIVILRIHDQRRGSTGQ